MYQMHCFARVRSEEHTSELQSQSNLVCRLLLEKKKKKNDLPRTHICSHPPALPHLSLLAHPKQCLAADQAVDDYLLFLNDVRDLSVQSKPARRPRLAGCNITCEQTVM